MVTDCLWHDNQNMQSDIHGNWDFLAGSTPIQTKPQVLEDAQSSPLQDVTEDFPSKWLWDELRACFCNLWGCSIKNVTFCDIFN
jgi:hypothetical protein